MDSETLISILFGAILALFSIATVGYSFVNNRRPLPEENATYSDYTDQDLANIFDAISTLALEFQLGRLSQEQFREQFQAYRLQAATVLRDKLEAGHGNPTWVLEQEILLARCQLENSEERIISCPDCSASILDTPTNCPHCGSELAS